MVQWGNVAEWAAAIGTVGALWFTYRLLRRETAELREARRDRDEQQARLVSVWATRALASSGPGGKSKVVEVGITNRGDRELFDLAVLVSDGPGIDADPNDVRGFVKAVIPPGFRLPHDDISMAGGVGIRVPPEPEGTRGTGDYSFDVYFKDGEGRCWHRSTKEGRLRRINDVAHVAVVEQVRSSRFGTYMN